MARGIDLTLQVVAQSKNQAVLGLLETAFQSTSKTIRKAAGQLLVSRRSGRGVDAVIRGFDPANPDLIKLVNDNRDMFVLRLHGAIVDEDATLALPAFRLAYSQNFYEVLPTLATLCLVFRGQGKSDGPLHNDFLRFLSKYVDALEKNKLAEHQLLYGMVLPEFSRLLEQKLNEYRFTRHELTLTVYLRLYPFFPDASPAHALNIPLRLPHSPIYVSAYRHLLNESEPYLFNFITRCLVRLNPPPLVPRIIAERSDIPFLEALFKSIQPPLTQEHRENIANLPPLPWLHRISSFVGNLDLDMQCGLVLLLQNITIKEEKLQACLLKIVEHGSGNGRAAALAALAPFSSPDIDQAIWNASEDAHPAIQIEALKQLSERAMPGAATRIMQFAGSPHEEVRHAIQKLLPNFRFSRFKQTFDQLDDEHRRRMFDVVRKLDPQTPDELAKMLSTGEPSLRAKALMCIDYNLEIVPLVEDALCDVLAHDEIQQLRCKSAAQLVAGRREESRITLVQALHRDADPDVRATAKNSLEKRPTYWNENKE